MHGKKVQCQVCGNLYTRENDRKPPEEMLRKLFSKRAVAKVGENSIFFLLLNLSSDQYNNYAS